jgi:hypothetical protein
MKKLIWQLIIPLTVISFEMFTKWWFVLVEDGPDEILTGFPLPYFCSGWHTSLSLQFFVTELIIDFFTYFTFWFLIIFLVNKYVYTFKPHKIRTRILLISSSLILALNILIASNPDNIFTVKRDFKTQVLETGFKFTKQIIERPNLDKYAVIQKDYYKGNAIDWNNFINETDIEISYINESSNPFLGGSYCKKIEDVNFIDKIIKLDKIELEVLFSIINDSNNFTVVSSKPERFFVYSGFIFTSKDTLLGSISMTYDLDNIIFDPNIKVDKLIELNNVGKSRMTSLISEIKKE